MIASVVTSFGPELRTSFPDLNTCPCPTTFIPFNTLLFLCNFARAAIARANMSLKPKAAIKSNLEVDYVIVYRFSSAASKSSAQADYEKLIEALARVGLNIEVRSGENQSILVFVKATNDERFNNQIYRSRYVSIAVQPHGSTDPNPE
jgi:hypothetical protein